MSLTKLLLLVLGAVCLIIGVSKLVTATFTVAGLGLPLLLIVVGFVLVSGRGITL